MTKLKEGDQFIHALVHNKLDRFEFEMTMVYANNDTQERSQLWCEVKEFCINRTGPWCVLGDLNSVLFSYEKKGGDSVHPREIRGPSIVLQLQ